MYKGSVRGLSEEQPRKKMEVSIKALQGKTKPESLLEFVSNTVIRWRLELFSVEAEITFVRLFKDKVPILHVVNLRFSFYL